MDKDLKGKLRIGVIGGSSVDETISALAYETGRLIARNNAILISGGLGGVMESACRGAKEEGGMTIGILPTRSKQDANPYVDIAIPTGLGEARNLIVVLSSDAVIAIDGSYGTLSEISFALLYKKPVFGIKSWHLQQEGREDKGIVFCSSPQEAVQKAIAMVQKNRCA
jgi:hypothetical protein